MRILLALAVCLLSSNAFGVECWPWPFKQNDKQLGVKFEERVVDMPNAAPRTWKQITAKGEDGNVEGKLLSVTEKEFYLLIAGQEKPIKGYKWLLQVSDQVYVRNLEIELAKQIQEPGAEDLEPVTEEDIREAIAAAEEAKRRTRYWADKTGKKTVFGQFMGAAAPMSIIIRTAEGEEIKVPISALSEVDRAFALQWIREDRAKK